MAQETPLGGATEIDDSQLDKYSTEIFLAKIKFDRSKRSRNSFKKKIVDGNLTPLGKGALVQNKTTAKWAQ